MTTKAVNRPTDPSFKEKDIINKLQLYGIYSAFAQGKAPSNQQIDVALNSVLASSALNSPPNQLSEEGKSLVADLKNVIEQAKYLLLAKNEGNLLQEFIWETQQISTAGTSLPGAPVDKETAKQHGNDLLAGLRTLGTLVISNGQFRKLLSDSAVLLRSIAGDAATNAAGVVQPSEEKLAQIDKPAEDNTWHDTPDTGKLKTQAKGFIPFGKKDLKEAANQGTAAAHPDDSSDPRDTAALLRNDAQQGTASSGVDAVHGAKVAANTLKSNANVDNDAPEKAKSKAKEYNAKTQNYLKGKMPKERREQTLWRLKKMVVEIQGHADYQQAIETLLRLAEEYGGHSKTIAADSQGTVKGLYNQSRSALTPLKTLLERFANGTSSDDFFDALNQIYRDADNDKELRDWFSNINTYIRRCLQEQGYIIQPAAQDDFNRLYDHGRFLLREKYRDHTDRVLDEIKFFGTQFDEDAQNHAFADAVTKLFQDLGQDDNGKSTFKPHLLKDVTEVILPRFLESVHYVPLPRLEYSDDMVDLIIENLIVESDNLAPNVLEFSSDNYWKWGRKTIKNKNKNKVTLAVSGVQMDLRDVSFYVKKKSGFPSLSDLGLCDIFMGGEGFSFKIKMETADATSRTHFFTISDVKVSVKNLNIKLKQSKHKLLFAIAKPLMLRIMRPALQKVLQAAIKQKAEELDSLLYEIYKEANQAKADIKNNPDPENVKNIFQLYMESANSQFMKAKKKADKVAQKAEGKKFNMAMTKRDSIFPNVDLPSGISTKATEFKDLADKGDKWQSPVFSIGSAKESSNLPGAPKVVRKHQSKPAVSTGSTYADAKAQPLGGNQQLSGGQQLGGASFPSNTLPPTNNPGATNVPGTNGFSKYEANASNGFHGTSVIPGTHGSSGAPTFDPRATPAFDPNSVV
jgi:hypothetical protein